MLFWGTQIDSQHLHDRLQTPMTSNLGDLMASSDPQGFQVYIKLDVLVGKMVIHIFKKVIADVSPRSMSSNL